jgi:helicase
MKRFPAGSTGSSKQDLFTIESTQLDQDWQRALGAMVPGGTLRPVQVEALVKVGILSSRRNLVVSAPTNSGKSLIGDLALYQAVRNARRAILIEPLRALAQEKASDLRETISRIPLGFFNEVPKVVLSTGDQRLELEAFTDPPPESGEIIVTTPERLDSIMRNPETIGWVSSIGALVVDEAHLIGSFNRGPTLELVIASIMANDVPPRIILLSATIGEPERLQNWLTPCDLIVQIERHPPLVSEIIALEDGEEADVFLVDEIRAILSERETAVLVFVYQRNSCKRLSGLLNNTLKDISATAVADAYHSGMSAAEKVEVRQRFADGQVRCVVTTTALALGVNLPATHVLLRDPTFHGVGRVETDTIIQVLGRAGRGNREGKGVVIVRPNDRWDPTELATALSENRIPAIKSAFEVGFAGDRSTEFDQKAIQSASTVAAAVLVRAGDDGMSLERIGSVLSSTFAGETLVKMLPDALRWLEGGDQALAFENESNSHQLTVLGKRAVRSSLPLPYAASLGRLVRDILSFDENDQYLAQWTGFDHLVIGCLLSDRTPSLRRYSAALADQIDGWHETQEMSAKSLVFREWIVGREDASRADELMGSLGIDVGDGKDAGRKKAYVAMFHAILLEERARGTVPADLARRWKVSDLEGIEEAWRDTVIWLLSGHAQLFELRCFYHQLLEGCDADLARIRRAKRILRKIRRLALESQGKLQYCSPLGPMLLGIRNYLKDHGGQVVGAGTIRRLEEHGITSIASLLTLGVEDLMSMGIRRDFARQIKGYVRRQMR